MITGLLSLWCFQCEQIREITKQNLTCTLQNQLKFTLCTIKLHKPRKSEAGGKIGKQIEVMWLSPGSEPGVNGATSEHSQIIPPIFTSNICPSLLNRKNGRGKGISITVAEGEGEIKGRGARRVWFEGLVVSGRILVFKFV